MPALTMRGRYLMREYWSDAALFTKMTPAEREVYIGLWMLADDAGWMPRDIQAIAAALFRYDEPAAREALVRSTLVHLRTLHKVDSLRCGCLYLPAVSRYPRAGKRSAEHLIAHQEHSNGFKRNQSHSNPSPDPTLPNPTLPDGSRASAGEDDGFASKMAASGFTKEKLK